MTQEHKEILLRDLCGRLPYGFKVLFENKVFSVDYISAIYEEIHLDIPDNYTVDISDIKPYLFPMSSMTDWEKEEYCQLQQRVIYNSKGPVNEDVTKYINWCYKKHLDINNLIPIGLAIDATDLNLY